MYVKIGYVVYVVSCISGLSWQVYKLSSSFFDFKVSTDILIDYSDSIPDEALNVCLDYYPIFQFQRYNDDTNQNITYNGESTESIWESKLKFFDNLTVDEILEYTPKINEILAGCQLRNVTPDGAMTELIRNNCLEYMDVSRFVNNYLVCYRFITKNSMEDYDDTMIAFDPVEPYASSQILFDLSYTRSVAYFLAFYNSKDSLPIYELIQATKLDRILASKNQVMYNGFGIRYKKDTIYNLESPYSTQCRKAKQRDHYLACVNESVVSKFNRLSPMSQHMNGSLKLMSAPLLQNLSNAQAYFDIMKNCSEMFDWFDCYSSVYTSANDEKIKLNIFLVYALLRNQGDIIIRNRARLTFLDYITLTFSCFGTWLGFSVLGLNPFKWKKGSVAPSTETVSRRRPMYQGQEKINQLFLDTLKQQQEWMELMDQELPQMVKNELKKLTRKFPH